MSRENWSQCSVSEILSVIMKVIVLTPDIEIEAMSSRELVSLKCEHCGHTFKRVKHLYQAALTHKHKKLRFCSKPCFALASVTRKPVICTHCQINFEKRECDMKKSKNHFCSQSCAATFNNLNKSHGTRRSKLEKWLEKQLRKNLKGLSIDFNKKSTIGSELDIYFPTLKIAFEVNGIFHYRPIHGETKFQKIKENDKKKLSACTERGIMLHTIDAQKNFSLRDTRPFEILKEIIDIINKSLGRGSNPRPQNYKFCALPTELRKARSAE